MIATIMSVLFLRKCGIHCSISCSRRMALCVKTTLWSLSLLNYVHLDDKLLCVVAGESYENIFISILSLLGANPSQYNVLKYRSRSIETLFLICVMWHVDPLIGDESADIFLWLKSSTIEGHPLLGNGPINTYYWQENTVFSMGSVPRAQSENRGEYNGLVEDVQSKMIVCQRVTCELL
jgi:hypothetical protein